MLNWTLQQAAKIGKALNPSHMSVGTPRKNWNSVPYQSTHTTGGAITGSDPKTSACNKYLQAWNVSNVFVMGACAFGQNAAVNPTGTVGALTYWAAEAITKQYLKSPGRWCRHERGYDWPPPQARPCALFGSTLAGPAFAAPRRITKTWWPAATRQYLATAWAATPARAARPLPAARLCRPLSARSCRPTSRRTKTPASATGASRTFAAP